MSVGAQEFGYFFNSNNGDRTYNAESFESWIKPFMSNGVFTNGMKVSAQSTPNMTVSVAAGYANLDGKLGVWPSANTMTIDTASGVYGRIDTIVLRRNNTNRQLTLEVVKGVASLSPSATPPTRDADVFELVLAQIYVGAGVTTITNSNITDTRMNTTLCGFVTCPVVDPDFSNLYDQFTAQFAEWFDHMKDQLDDDAAGHLQLEIDDIKADIGIVEDGDTATHTIAAGQYVIWKGSLYKATVAIPATTALSLSNLTAVSGGLGEEVASLNSQITQKANQEPITNAGCVSPLTISDLNTAINPDNVGNLFFFRAYNGQNAPANGVVVGFTIGYDTNNVLQFAFKNDNVYTRLRSWGNWSAWTAMR